MSKAKILRTDGELFIIEDKLGALRDIADVVTVKSNDVESIKREVEDADLILTCYDNINGEMIESARNLKGIVKYGVGVDNIDIETATKKGILVVNCPSYGTDTVADHAFTLMMCLARKITLIDKIMKSKAWEWPLPKLLGADMSGKTIGIIGLGKIGRAMAKRAEGFGMRRIAFDPYVDEKTIEEDGVEFVSLDDLLKQSDFISLHCVLTPETKGLLGENEFKKMKKSALIINVSRGAIIDEEALIKALREGWIAGAGFDVYRNEPLNLDYPLLGMDNVILTPHFAWYTEEALGRVDSETLQSVLDVLQGRIPKNLKNKEVLNKEIF